MQQVRIRKTAGQPAPHHLIDNNPALEATGRDQQLEMAIQVLLSQLDRPDGGKQ